MKKLRDERGAPTNLLPRDGVLLLHPAALASKQSHAFYRELFEGVAWESHRISLFGREVLEPRLSAWVGDCAYRYSGRLREPLPWTPVLRELRDLCERMTGARFNSVLCNLYRDGADSMGWHSDDEPELGDGPVIASISLGATRRFRMRHRATREQVTLELPSGSLLVMSGECQRFWQHAVPKTAREVDPRINLTFRRILEV